MSDRIFIVVVPNYWGIGNTIDEAKRNCERAGAGKIRKRTPRVIAITDDTNAYVDGVDGSIYHAKGAMFEVIERFPVAKAQPLKK